MSEPGIQMATVYIVMHKTEQGDKRIGAVYFYLDQAKREAERLSEANSWSSAYVVIREVQVTKFIAEQLNELFTS